MHSIRFLLQPLSTDFKANMTLKLIIDTFTPFHLTYSGINGIYKHK